MTSGTDPQRMIATKLACGNGLRSSLEIKTSGMSPIRGAI